MDKIGDRLPSQSERDAARQLRNVLTTDVKPNDNVCIRVTGTASQPQQVVLPPALLKLMTDLLDHVSSGDAVNLLPVNQTLTADQAANLLGVPLPYFLGLLRTDVIRHELIGRHHRVAAKDLFEYKRKRDVKRATALGALADIDADSI